MTNDELAAAYWDTAGRALARDIIAACDARHRQEMEAYELTVSNLRAELAQLEAQLAEERGNAQADSRMMEGLLEDARKQIGAQEYAK